MGAPDSSTTTLVRAETSDTPSIRQDEEFELDSLDVTPVEPSSLLETGFHHEPVSSDNQQLDDLAVESAGVSSLNAEHVDGAKLDIPVGSDQIVPGVSQDAAPIPTDTAVSTHINIDGQVFIIHPADRGRHAYLFLLACFVLEALVWGFPFSYGVFQAYYAHDATFSGDPIGVAAVGTSALGVMYLWAPISMFVGERWPGSRKYMSHCGLCIMLPALFVSAFATKVWHLVITQGVLYGIGGSFLYSPTIFYLDDWFEERKALAMGVMWAGVGSSGVVFPFLLSKLLDKTGHMWTMILWALMMGLICMSTTVYIGPRTQSLPTRSRTDKNYLHTGVFMELVFGNMLQGLGFFIPALYLPQYVSDLGRGYDSNLSVAILAVLNISSVGGTIFFGAFCDRVHVKWAILLSSFMSIVSLVVCWGLFGTSIQSLVLFGIGYGFFAGGFSAIWMGMILTVRDKFPDARMGELSGIFAATRGIGSIFSGPLAAHNLGNLSTGLMDAKLPKSGFESNYGMLIIMTIVFMGLSGFCALLLPGWRKFIRKRT